MRVTRYLWINNLPHRVTEADIREVLQSHGKIQSVRIHEQAGNSGAVVAFVDTKSATKAMESTIRLKKVHLSLQYCESSGIPGSNSDHIATALDHYQTNHNNSTSQSNDSCLLPRSPSSSVGSNPSPLIYGVELKKANVCSLPVSKSSSKNMFPSAADSNSPRTGNDYRGLKISHLPLRSSDTNLREGLFHEYKKHGKITSVFVRGQGDERICVITFKKCEDAQRALASSKGKVFFGTPIYVVPHEGLDSEDPDLCPPEHALNEYHPKATKTLFVGNLCSSTITQDELRRTFRVYGEIIEIDIKIQTNQPGTSYAFIQYGDIASVVRALNDQDTVRIGGKSVKLGFGKSQPTNVVWLDNLAPNINEAYLTRQFGRYGQLTHVVFDRKSLKALLYFDSVEMAQRALNETRNRAIIGRKVQLDYAGYECQVAFMRKLARHDNFGQVYENYRERVQELLSLWPAYGNVLPFIDRQKCFQENQHESSLHSGNTKFSYRRSNYPRPNTCDRVSKRDQIQNRSKMSSVSPHNRLQNNSDHSVDRKRPNSTLDDSKPPSNWTGSRSSRNTCNSSNYGKTSTGSVSEDKFGGRYRRVADANFNPTKSNRCGNHGGSKAMHDSHLQLDRTSLRGRVQFVEDIDEVSSGSYSSEMTVDESSFEFSIRRRSSGSSEHLLPTSKTPSHIHKDHAPNNNDKRREYDLDISRRSHRIHPYDSNCDNAYTLPTKKHNRKNVDCIGSSSRTRVSSRRSLFCSRAHTMTDQYCSIPSNCHRSGDESFEKSDKSSCRTSRQSSKPSDFSESNSHHARSRCTLRSHASSVPKDSHATGQPNSVTSPISSDDLFYKKKDEPYSTSKITDNETNADSPNISVKPHDALSKLELERAKLLRELSLLNNEVIGGNKSKTHSHTNTIDYTSKKHTLLDTVVIPPPKVKCFESDIKYNTLQTHSPTFLDDRCHSSPVKHGKTNPSDQTSFKGGQTSKRNLSPSCQTVDEKRHRGPLLHTPTSDPTKLSPPTAIANVSTASKSSDVSIIHGSNKRITLSYGIPLSECNSSIPSFSQKSVLMSSSPRLPVQTEPTSPLNNISLSNSLLNVNKLSFAASVIVSAPPNLSSQSTSGSKLILNTGSASRDPRLAVHHEIPPPPPETFKLPLWVDTSTQLEIDPPNLLLSSSKPRSPSKPISITETEQDISFRDSLDERIRLLDMQLMKTEKARSTVDYSKFRIRRKAEVGCSSQLCSNITSSLLGSTTSFSGLYTSPTSALNSNLSRSEQVASNLATSQLMSACNVNLIPASPVLSTSTHIKPADTCDFVKSMLFSSKSLLSPCNETPICVSAGENMINREFVSSPTYAVLTRIPRTSAPDNVSSVGVTQTLSTLTTRSIGTYNGRPHAERSLLCGTPPVGVATRMPSVQSCSVDSLPKLSGELMPTNQLFKTPNKGECNYNPMKFDQSHSIISQTSEMPVKTSTLLSCNRNKSPTEVSIKTTPKLTGNFCRLNSTELKECLPTDANKSKLLPSFSSKPTIKTARRDTARPTLDDSVFQNSWANSTLKLGRVKNLKKKPLLANDGQELCNENSNSAPSRFATKQLTAVNLSTKFIDNHRHTLKPRVDLLTDFPKSKSRPNPHGAEIVEHFDISSMLKDHKSDTIIRKKKKIKDSKKRAKFESDESEMELDSNTSLPQHNNEMSHSLCEQRYESMYDKIKRRTNKISTVSNELKTEPVVQGLIKGRSKQPKKATRKSFPDSDTDECLSDNNSDDVYRRKFFQKTSLETSNRLSKSPKQRTNSGGSQSKVTGNVSSVVLSRKRKKQTNIQLNLNESSAKGKCKKAQKNRFSSSNQLLEMRTKRKVKSQLNVSTSTTGHSLHSSHKRASYLKDDDETLDSKQSPRLKGMVCDNDKVEDQKLGTDLRSSAQCTKSTSNIKSGQKRLVQHVFASTDSSLSSSVMSDASDDDPVSFNTPVPHYSAEGKTVKTSDPLSCGSHSKSSSPLISRSCSPEDLRADDATRHTFGAFTAPFSILTTGSKVDPCASTNTNLNSSRTVITQEPDKDYSKPTPPTLLMTDSDHSVDQQFSIDVDCRDPTRDLNDWNIHSLPKQSTPICDDKFGSCEQQIQFGGMYNESDKNSHLDDMDELPSLEKHDDDSSNLYDSSILLHESGCMTNRVDCLNDFSTDDLPPLMITTVDQPTIYPDTEAPEISHVADVIEEVIYDGTEVQPLGDEFLLDARIQIRSDQSPISKSDQNHNAPTDSLHQNAQVSSSDSATDDQIEATTSQPPRTLSTTPTVAPVTLQSTIFTPVAMLTTKSQSEVATVGQPMLVTIPKHATPNSFNSSNLALLTEVNCPTSQPFLTSASQHHITVILPATSACSTESTVTSGSSCAVTSIISSTMTVSEFSDTPTSVMSSPQVSFTCSVSTQSPTCSLTSGSELLTTDASTTSVQSLCLSSTCQSTSNVTFDPSDFTSYVQRVIERVKQEKDEEILHQREKVKRPKRTAVLQPSCTTTTPSVISTTSVASNTVASPGLPVTGLVIPGVHVCPNFSSQSEGSTYALSMVSNSCVLTPNEVVVSNSKPNYAASVTLSASNSQSMKNEVENGFCGEPHRTFTLMSSTTCEPRDRDVVDEIIEAVVNGDFDEKDYAQKLQKGTFAYGSCQYRTSSNNIGSPVYLADSLASISCTDEENSIKCTNYKFNFSDSVPVSSPRSLSNDQHPSPSLSTTKDLPDQSTSTASTRMLTPMHVLTFIPTAATTSSSQQLYAPTAISPNVSKQSLSITTKYTPTIASINIVSKSSTSTESLVDRTLLPTYVTSSNGVETLSSNSSGTRIERFAAQLANNPLTTYFYSLLTQNQSSPPVSAGESVCPRSIDNISIPICATTLKDLPAPTAVSVNTSDYLTAAAKVAAMAAMSVPSQSVGTVAQNCTTSTVVTDIDVALPNNHFSKCWTSDQLFTQNYPIIWRGRLSLKNEEVYVHMHYINGNQTLLKGCMNIIAEQQGTLVTNNSSVCYPLKIVQRMRLEASQLEGVQRKLRQLNDFCMCLTLAAAPPLTVDCNLVDEEARMNRILYDGFIKYMLDKCAAGIINVYHPCTQQNLFVIHIFPPCEFSQLQLQGYAPNLAHSLSQNSVPHVLTVITTV